MTNPEPSFSELALPEPILNAIGELGYETPSPIQAQAIPPLLEGRDILGQAQTGTGKTAAFALPMLAKIGPLKNGPSALILAPTRELAIQVAEACQSYAKFIKNFHVLPIYGGQSYTNQLRQLKRGVQVVVGTPGRVMDHMRRGTLKLDNLEMLILDEADEMLRMGFIDDVKWILEQTPASRQIALFSATMPNEVKKVAETHLQNPVNIKIAAKTSTAQTIRQRYWLTAGIHKLDALTRILEVEDFDGMIIFVRTKLATEELATKLNARGFSVSALNGDIPQAAREKTVDRLKKGNIDILVATDVVARGLDVERISHVINYDVPYDTEAYVHRIGRTGRAGRSGDAILFVAPREKRMLRAIEKVSGKAIEAMKIPTAADINVRRIDQFKQGIMNCLENENLDFYKEIVEELASTTQADPINLAAALAHMSQGGRPLLLDTKGDHKLNNKQAERGEFDRQGESKRDRKRGKDSSRIKEGPIRPLRAHPDVELVRYKMEVGYSDNATPGQIVAAIANAADMSSDYIGQIELYENVSTIDLPEGMPKALFKVLEKTRVANKQIKLKPLGSDNESSENKRSKPSKKRSDKPKKSKKPQTKKQDTNRTPRKRKRSE